MHDKIRNLMLEMIKYYSKDPKRIQHFTKVYTYAVLIGESENMDEDDLFVLSAAALVHDIGIKNAEKKFNSCSGKLQEQEGPPEAERLLKSLGFSDTVTERVSYLVAHHHTYDNIDALDYQILVEADFIVNMYEDNCTKEACETACQKIFKTSSGTEIFKTMFL